MKKGTKLAKYLIDKSKELDLSLVKLSKLIKPGSSGSIIGGVILGKTRLSENNIKLIARFFKVDKTKLIFLSGRIPKKIEEMIIEEEIIQQYLTREFKQWEKKGKKK